METEFVLPPRVCGHPNGELIVKVDEIFWTKKSPGDVFVHLQWWGEKNYNVFWPIDLNQKLQPQNERPNSVTYTIRTSEALFETYLKNCRDLTFYIVKETDRTIVGNAIVKDLADIIVVKTYSSFSSYYPIYNLQKNRIGDLRISFSLYFKKKSSNALSTEILPRRCPLVLPSTTKVNHSLNHYSRSKTIEEAVSRGQELRKAMVKSILKDCPIDKVENIINTGQEAAGDSRLLSSKESAQLIDYVTGKNLTVSDSKVAVKMLHCISPSDSLDIQSSSVKSSNKSFGDAAGDDVQTTERQNTPPNLLLKEERPATKINESSSRPSKAPVNPSSNSTISIQAVYSENSERKAISKLTENYKILQTMDCFRFTILELKLNGAGSKKVSNTPALKPTERQIRVANAPGTLFSVEFTLPVRSAHRSFCKPSVFVSKKQHGQDVTFGDSVTHKLPQGHEFPWLKVFRLCGGAEIKIYWRHLNQRLPSFLGATLVPDVKSANYNTEELSPTVNLIMPVMTNTKLVVGKLFVCVELGRNCKAFGNTLFKTNKTQQEIVVKPPLLEGTSSIVSIEDTLAKTTPENILFEEQVRKENKLKGIPTKEFHLPISSPSTVSTFSGVQSKVGSEVLRVIDVLNKKLNEKENNNPSFEKNTTDINDKTKESKRSTESEKETPVTKTETKTVEFNLKNQSSSNDKITHEHHQHSTCCCCCKRYCGVHPQNSTTFENERHERSLIHEFTISIHKVCDFPLFTKDHDMDCFVDYKFPYISPIDGCLSLNTTPFTTETTIALRNTHFSTAHTHKLKLSKNLVESLVTLHKQDLVFRLWGRTYNPVPRDHKVAKARIPLTKLTSLELKFEQEMQEASVSERLKVPLEIVRSSLTSGLQGYGDIGSLIVGLHYRRYKALRGDVNEARNIVETRNKNIKSIGKNFEEEYFNYHQKYETQRCRRLSPPNKHLNISSHYSKYVGIHNSHPEIPELDPGAKYTKSASRIEREPVFENYRSRFDSDFLSKDIPSHDHIDLVDSPPLKNDYDSDHLKTSISPRPHISESFRLNCRTPLNLDSRTLNDPISLHPPYEPSQLHKVEIHKLPANSIVSPSLSPPLERNVDLYSSQDPLQMKKNLVGNNVRLSEEFEILSQPSFLAGTSPPRLERDFPPGVTTNLDITATNIQTENPFEQQFNSGDQCGNIGDEIIPSNRRSMSVAVETDSQESEHKSTQTSLVQSESQLDAVPLGSSGSSDDWFIARVCIERAINLPMVPAFAGKETDDLQLVEPSTYVQFRAKCGAEVKVITTNTVHYSTVPIWDSTWQLQLPTSLLYKNDEDLELFVGCSGQPDPLGKVCIDLTAISAGLSSIDGWYLISDGIRSAGQIKVMVTPLEDVSRFKEKWLKEYSKKDYAQSKTKTNHMFDLSKKENTKTKTSSNEQEYLHSAISSSIGNVDAQLAASLRSKISEMELLTDRMKKKISDKSSWEDSPPCLLLGKATDYIASLETTDKMVAGLKFGRNDPKVYSDFKTVDKILNDKHLVDTGNSPIIISDDEENVIKRNVTTKKPNDDIIFIDSSSSDVAKECQKKILPFIDLTENQSDSSQDTYNRLSSLEESKFFEEETFNTYTVQEEANGCSEDSLEIVSYNDTDMF